MIKVASIVLNNFKNDSRVLKENISLSNAGYSSTVVALHEEPLEEFQETHNVRIHRVKLHTRSWSRLPLIQVLKYLEFCFTVAKKYSQSDIIHCNDLKTLPVGAFIRSFFNRKIKIVYDAHEYETETIGLKGVQKILLKQLEKRLIHWADQVITVSNSIANEYVRLYGIQKPALVLNTPPLKLATKQDRYRESLGIKKGQLVFLYQGGLTPGRGIEILLDAFESMEDDTASIVFMGYGSLESRIKSSKVYKSRVFFHAAVSPDVILEYTASADFGISTIEDTCLSYRYCLPNKMFEYLMADIPIIVSNLPEMKRIVESNKVGIVASENTVEGLRLAIKQAISLDRKQIKNNILNVKKTYNWEEQEKVLLQVYSDLYAN